MSDHAPTMDNLDNLPASASADRPPRPIDGTVAPGCVGRQP